MSLAARVKARQAAGVAFDFEARRIALQEAEARNAAAETTDSATVIIDGKIPGGVAAPRRPSPAQRAALKAAAAQQAANENVLDGSADLSPYEQVLVKLHNDKQRLKQIQSTEGKVDLKRQLLPEYEGWVIGRLDAAQEANARPTQDDVLAHILMWSIDTGDYARGLELAGYFLRFDHVLPAKVKRDVATFVTEELAEAALAAFRRPETAAAFPAAYLAAADELFADRDMPDPVRAKLKKAIGQALLTAIEGQTELPPANAQAVRTSALEFLRRAQELNPASGCVKLIEGLERDIKNNAEPPA